ncbi:hypothetical protein Trydic_g5644 [Trypoxylus dichotomus]
MELTLKGSHVISCWARSSVRTARPLIINFRRTSGDFHDIITARSSSRVSTFNHATIIRETRKTRSSNARASRAASFYEITNYYIVERDYALTLFFRVFFRATPTGCNREKSVGNAIPPDAIYSSRRSGRGCGAEET